LHHCPPVCIVPVMNDFQPWSKYADISKDRLSVIAGIIRRVTTETLALHDAGGGDNQWSLGCRIYSRTCHALREAAHQYQWLKILPELEGLRFSFAIGSVSFRFYRGKPDDPPERYLMSTFGELHHLQRTLQIEGLRPVDKVLRLAVEPDRTEVCRVTFVEMDEAGNVTETYRIPLVVEEAKVTPLQAKPVDLPAPPLEPLKPEAEEVGQKRREGKTGNVRKLGS
jgi:hypothetical protein